MVECLQFHPTTQWVYVTCPKNYGCNTGSNSVQAIINVCEAMASFIKNLRHDVT